MFYEAEASNHNHIYAKASELWGERAQLNMLHEELSELQVALCHFLRGRCGKMELIEEVADALIVIEQLVYIIGVVPGDGKGKEAAVVLKTFIKEKVDRLLGRVRKADPTFEIRPGW